jgi:fused signal recognition particle receptor
LFNWIKKTELGVKRSKETWFNKIAHLFDQGAIREETWEELEELLISADVGIETTAKLLDKVKQQVKADKLTEALQVKSVLKEEMVNLLNIPNSLCSEPSEDEESPQVILVVGVNGSGKTTSIAKLSAYFASQGKKVILAAADTFRAAAIDQLKYWGREVNAEVVAHKPGGDPGAVAFDAVEAAHSRHAQAVIIDTAGRLHTKFNLMEELKKIKRVAAKHDASAPHQILLVMDATTGQNGLAQAKYFTQAVGVTDIFLAKLDGTAKGGIVFAICDELSIPIAYIGTGEKLQDIAPFDAEAFVNAIL